ncbi:cation channel sperm-associated protein 1-like [Colias croceus]|uniref:cation channel sperm-associated protein 1-like n=1 Tax=Colias crocea TaxID=72248 RepID=UPI001E27C8C3|nr:cation channel sperm-associated protein 1-like [Colias croceus]
MRAALLVVAVAVALATEVFGEAEPWVEEEDVQDYSDYRDYHDREKRDVHVEGPYDEHVRVKRCHDDGTEVNRAKRSAQPVHQYEVYEPFEEGSYPAPSYQEMLAASAEHYHKVYLPPNARVARHLNTQINAGPLTFGVHPDPIEIVPGPVNLVPAPANFNPVQFTNQPASIGIVQQQKEDLAPAAGHHVESHKPHAFGYEKGFGHAQGGSHFADHGGKSAKGSKSNHYLDKGGKGHKTDELHRKEYEEAAGKKRKHHDHAGHKGSHEEEAFGQRGAHFDEKKGHRKGHKTKGFHNKYHKDEFHKEHKFYDDFHKGGEHHRYGKFNARHATNESGKKKAHHVNAGHDFVEKGKNGYSKKGHVDADHRGYKGQAGHEDHHEHHSQHGKKGAKEGGSQWGYAKKN